MKRGAGLGLSLAVAVGLVVVDQLTKWWALNTLNDEIIDVVWTLRLNLTFNSGAAFGKGTGLGPYIGFLAIFVVVGIVVGSRRSVTNVLSSVAVGLVLGGAVGNLLDRLFRHSDGFLHGRVVDWIDLQWWPVFNVADMGLSIGGVLLVLSTLLESRPHPTASTDISEPAG